MKKLTTTILATITTTALFAAAPVFTVNPFSTSNATVDTAYAASIATSATDADGDTIIYTILAGPKWISIQNDGSLSGTPSSSNVGVNKIFVRADDGNGGRTDAMLEVTVE